MMRLPIATAMADTIRKGYRFADLRRDAGAAIVVALIALPLSMALSIAVGLPPQHGLYTAIVAGIVTALLGGSAVQVSGPTAAFVAIIAPIVAQFGLHGLIWCQLMAGAILIVMGIARLGKVIAYVPYPVTTGFTAGIAVVIATLSLNDFLGLGIESLGPHYIDKLLEIVAHLSQIKPAEATIGMATLLVIIGFGKVSRVVPAPVAGMGVAAAMAFAFSQMGVPVDTIATRFSYLATDGATIAGIPPFLPSLHLPGGGDPLFAVPGYEEFRSLLGPAFVVAALAALESLLSATVADNMTGQRHDPNAELTGIGLGNIASGLAAGIPATGAIARTASNIHAGGRTPVAAILHAVLIAVCVVTIAPFISQIPMAALAALLLVTAWRMAHAHQFLTVLKIGARSDVAVLLICFILTVFVDMVAGVTAGIILSAVLFMRRVSAMTQVSLGPASETLSHLPPEDLPADVLVFTVDGPLFFGTAERAIDRSGMVASFDKVVIDIRAVPIIDMSGIVAMESLLTNLKHHKRIALLGRPHIVDQIVRKLPGDVAGRIERYLDPAEALAAMKD